jgi:hypothetical protein
MLLLAQTTQGVLQALRGYGTQLNKQKCPSQHISRNECLLRYGRVNVWVAILGDQTLAC